jgi:release factor glutamine methyltransferase
MTIHEALGYGAEILQQSGLTDPPWNAERLLLQALHTSRAAIYSELQKELDPTELEAYQRLLQRRAAHEPLAYIEGTQEFFGREFHVSPAVLIPRPETEEIVRAALELPLAEYSRILDIGAGSGCIGITLALETASPIVVALEYSAAAIPVLRRNAVPGLHIVRGNLFSLPFSPETFDLIVSNPPYVEEAEFPSLPRETLWEPREGLLAPSLEGVYEALLSAAGLLLRTGGYLIFEFGFQQQERLEALCRKHSGLRLCSIRPDFRNILRACILQKT